MIDFWINASLLLFLIIISIAILCSRQLFSAIMLNGIFSLLCAAIYVSWDAVDVAFTEASVGAGISTVLFLAALAFFDNTEERSQLPIKRKLLALCISLATGVLLLIGTIDMPHFGDPNSPAQQHLAQRFLYQSPQEIDVPNAVTAVLASYRGYDTMGETLVVFIAGVAVFGLLGNVLKRPRRREKRAQLATQHDDLVLGVFTKLMAPLIILFALYVQFHGDFGPGGGFQAGVIFAAGFILYGLVFSVEELMLALPPKTIRILMALGISLYALTGVLTMVLGGQFLDYNKLAHDPIHGQHYGIFIVELGVGLSVAGVMISLFYSFMNYRPLRRWKDSKSDKQEAGKDS